MTKREQNRVKRKRSLEANGWGLRSEERDAVKAHTSNETLPHYHLKAEVARQANNAKSTVFSEVSNGQGIADILLLRENTQPLALVVEIETEVATERTKEKRETFMGSMIQEVLVWDPTKAPTDLGDMQEWVSVKLDGFL